MRETVSRGCGARGRAVERQDDSGLGPPTHPRLERDPTAMTLDEDIGIAEGTPSGWRGSSAHDLGTENKHRVDVDGLSRLS